MNELHDGQWTNREVFYIKTTGTVFSVAVVIVPFFVPLDLVQSSATLMYLYNQLSLVFPYLAWSLPLSSEPEFYIVSKLILFALGFFFVISIGVIPLSRDISIDQYQTVSDARNAIWWFWILFAVFGYGAFFWMYSSGTNLSWASRAAIGSTLGIAVGNFAQFGVFALLGLYVLLVRQYIRLRLVWKVKNGGSE